MLVKILQKIFKSFIEMLSSLFFYSLNMQRHNLPLIEVPILHVEKTQRGFRLCLLILVWPLERQRNAGNLGAEQKKNVVVHFLF